MSPKRRLLFDDEALASDDSEEDEYESESENSLDDFIVDDNDTDEDMEDDDEEFDDLNRDDMEIVHAEASLVGNSSSSSTSRPMTVNTTTATTSPKTTTTTTKTTPPTSSSKRRGRPPLPRTSSSAKPCPTTIYNKPPGHPHYRANKFSLTISKLKGDVQLDLLDAVHDYLAQHAVKSGLSTEVGHRAHNLHIQGTFIMKYPSDKTGIADLVKVFKNLIKTRTGSLTGYRVYLKPLANNQSFSTMIGYITKDDGQPHYKLRTHNVTRDEMDQGRREHLSMLSRIDDEKKVVTLKNFFNECFRFNRRSFAPCVVPLDYVLTYMLQSGNYILTPDFVTGHRKMDLMEAELMWKLIHDAANASVEEVRRIVFDPRSYDQRRVAVRYFMAGHLQPEHRASSSTEVAPSEVLTAEQEHMSSSSTPASLQYSIDREGDENLCLATRLVHRLQDNRVIVARERVYPTDDIVAVEAAVETVSVCPPTIAEMMAAVRDIRKNITARQTTAISQTFCHQVTQNTDSLGRSEDMSPYDMFCDFA